MDLLGSKPETLRAWAQQLGLQPFRAKQIADGIWRQEAHCFRQIKGLPKADGERLDALLPLLPAEVDREQHSADGTVKTLLRLHDGKLVECVSIPTHDRHTICVSSQVGCNIGCTFCASGLTGSERNLTPGEIAFQVLYHHRRRPVTNVVFMGSGEPLLNYDNVRQAIAALGDDWGLGMGRRRFTVSTSGLPERIRAFGSDEPQVTLALSLHAPDDETRSQIVPINKRWPIGELMAAMDDYRQVVKRRITLEYVLLADCNMRDDQAQALAAIALRHQAHINLIPFNPVSATPHQRPTQEQVDRFASQVVAAGGHVTLRGQRGADIDAACGQLVRRAKDQYRENLESQP